MKSKPIRHPLYFILCILPLFATAQPDAPAGARAAALGNATAALADVWALHNSVAGIAKMQQAQVGAYVENRFGMRELTTVGLMAVYPTAKYGSYGLHFSRFGDELYSQQSIGLGAAHKLGQFSLGAKLDVWQVAVKGYGNQRAVSISIGGQAEIIPGLYFGTYAYNLTQAKLASFEDERLPTIMKAGIAYQPYRKLLLLAETEKNIDYDATFKAGVEYQLLEDRFILRSGLQTLTNTLTFGAGFQARSILVDYAFGNTTQLGNSHHLSVTYSFKHGS